MSNKISIPNGNGEPQTKLTTPERLAAMAVAIVFGFVGFKFVNEIMQALFDLLATTFGVLIMAGGLALIAAILLNSDIRRALFYLFKMAMRNIAGVVYTIDPIAVAKITLDETREEAQKLDEQITVVAKQHGAVDLKIRENDARMREKFDFANEAKRQGNEKEAALAAIEGGALKDSNDRLIPIATDTKRVLNFLEKLKEATDFTIRKMDTEISIKEAEYKIVKATHSAMKTAINIFNGGNDRQYAFITSMDYVQQDMGEKLGEIKRAMKLSTQFVEGVDIQNGVYEKKGLDMLEQYNMGKLLGTAGENKLSGAMKIPVAQPLGTSRNSHLLD